jgi:hypothetical protein
VKSPVASLCFVCSSVRNRVRVTMSVLIFSTEGGSAPFDAILRLCSWFDELRTDARR